MAAIETAIERPDFQIDEDEMVTKDIVHDEIHKYKQCLIQISARKKSDLGTTSSIWSPFTFIGAVFTLPMWIGRGNIKGVFDKRAEKAQMQKYQKDTSGYLTQRALYVLDKFAEADNVRKYVVSQLKPVYNVVSKLENTVPKMIDADKELMATLKRDTRSVEEIKVLYEPTREVFDKQYGLLSKYGYEDIREFNIETSEVKGYNSPPISRCGYFNYHHMEISTNGADIPVISTVLKRYLPDLNEECAYLMRKEEENFRKLRFPNIPHLIGLIQDPGCTTKKPSFLLQNCLYSLRKLQRGEVNKRPASFYKPIAVQSVVSYVRDMTCGLDFLHRKGLVHIELSLDTLMISTDSRVMLTNISLPRKVQEPQHTSKGNTWFTYLSPEVLQGGIYDTAADIYSVGLAMWELWYGEKITPYFKDEDMVSMEVFAKHVTCPQVASDKPMHKIWGTIMSGCLSETSINRPIASQIFNDVKKIKWEEEEA
ncbi:inactive tyrosine-protein kinase 7-like [Glandiceps talaboti]